MGPYIIGNTFVREDGTYGWVSRFSMGSWTAVYEFLFSSRTPTIAPEIVRTLGSTVIVSSYRQLLIRHMTRSDVAEHVLPNTPLHRHRLTFKTR